MRRLGQNGSRAHAVMAISLRRTERRGRLHLAMDPDLGDAMLGGDVVEQGQRGQGAGIDGQALDIDPAKFLHRQDRPLAGATAI